jgi:hypothetical protein
MLEFVLKSLLYPFEYRDASFNIDERHKSGKLFYLVLIHRVHGFCLGTPEKSAPIRKSSFNIREASLYFEA